MFQKYEIKNNAICTLSLPITNMSTLLIASGNYDRFPTSNFIAKVTQFSDGVVVGRENIFFSSRSGANFVVSQRACEPVPIDDNASTQIQQALSFESGSVIELVNSALVIKDIQDEVTRLETDKLNKSTYYAEQEVFSATVTGNDAYQIISSTVLTYNNGQTFKVQADVGNDGACTLQLNALGAKFIKKYVSGVLQNLETGDIAAGQIFWATYNSLADCFQFAADPATAPIVSVGATESTFTAGENITVGNALYVSNGAGGRTSGRVYKTNAVFTTFSDAGNFIGFAKETITTGNPIKVLTAGVSTNHTGLTIGADYYITNTDGAISTTPGTNVVSVGKAVSTTSIEINPLFRRNDLFGEYVSRSSGVNYQASESGIVIASSNGATNDSSRQNIAGYIGNSNPASTFVVGDQCIANSATTAYCSISFPVKKGKWYRVDTVSTNGVGFTINFIPNI